MRVLLLLILLLVSSFSFAEGSKDIDSLLKSLSVPVPKKVIVFELPPVFDYSLYAWYADSAELIRVTDATEIDVRVQGYGGSVLLVNQFGQALLDAQAQGKEIVMDVVGPAYSGHAYITCYANKVILRNGGALMFHAAYTIDSYFFGLLTHRNMMQDPASHALNTAMFAQCKKVGRLTDKDIAVIEEGRDVTVARYGDMIVTTYSEDDESTSAFLSQIFALIASVSAIIVVIGLVKRI